MAQIQWLDGLSEGRGINGATGEIFQPAITFDPPEAVGTGQKPRLDLRIISSSKQLASLLSVDAAASLRVKARGNVSAQAKFSDQQQINSYYQYALVTVSVTNPTQLIRNPILKDDARNLLERYGWGEFAKYYGPEFVEGYIPGGYYYALIEIQTTDSSKQQEIAAQLSGSYNGFGVDASASTEAKSQIGTALKDQKISVSVCQSGGSGDPLEVTLDDMINQAINFPKLIKENPVFMTAITNTYERAVPPLLPRPLGSQLSWNHQKKTLDKLGEQYLKLDDYKSNLEFVLKNFNKFDRKEERAKFQASVKATEEQIRILIEKARNCFDDCEQCESYTLPETFEYLELPEGDLITDSTPPTRITWTSVTAPTNASSFARLKEYDVPNQKKFEVKVKLSTLILEESMSAHARLIGLGIYSTKNGKIVYITRTFTNKGHRLISGDQTTEQSYEDYPEDIVYFRITKQDDEVDLLFSRNGSYFKSMGKRNLKNLGFPADDTYKVVFTGYSTDSTPVSGKFYDLIIR